MNKNKISFEEDTKNVFVAQIKENLNTNYANKDVIESLKKIDVLDLEICKKKYQELIEIVTEECAYRLLNTPKIKKPTDVTLICSSYDLKLSVDQANKIFNILN